MKIFDINSQKNLNLDLIKDKKNDLIFEIISRSQSVCRYKQELKAKGVRRRMGGGQSYYFPASRTLN